MAESGRVSGLLGADSELPAEASAPETQLDPTAAALAAEAAKSDPELAEKACAYFEKQSHLVEVQTEHLHEQRAVNLQLLKLKRLDERLRVGLRMFVILVATTLGIGAIMIVRDAMKSRGVVIDEFDVAPNIAAQVPSGKIVAAGLLDVLTRIQAATRSDADHRNLSNAWTGDIAIEVPETGISIGQLERVLKSHFGHELHIDGDLVKVNRDGLALTVRGSGILPKTFTDDKGDLNRLLTQAGEYVYGQSQPGLWAAYLSNNDRNDEAIRFAEAAYSASDLSERPYVLNYWANAITGKGGEGAMVEALRLWRAALQQKPDYWVAYNNIMFGLAALGNEEGVVRVGEQLLKAAGGRPGRAPEYVYQNYDLLVWDLPAVRASSIADIESHGGIGTTITALGAESLTLAATEVQQHDIEAAMLRLKTTPIDEKNPGDLASAAMARALIAEEVGDFKTAAREWDAFEAAYADPSVSTSNPQYICLAAVTYEKTGQQAKADAALDLGRLRFVDCDRFKGDVLDLRGDWPGAQKAYAESVALAPDLPAGYYSWGLALTKHGNLAEAEAKLKAASQHGPHWADPLKAWGDVLVKQGKTKDALGKYDEAVKYAPNWKQLKEAREAVETQRT
jgi:tetratricopeptide (TPR) repeat protein